MSLDKLRHQIDNLDEKIVRLLNERIKIVQKIGKTKKNSGDEIYVPARERAVFEKITKLNDGPLPDESAHAIYREIMSAALALETDMKISYLGPEATFTHQAARSKFGASVEYVPAGTISDVFYSVQNRSADYGVVPIENSTEGAVTHTFDQFAKMPLKICAEIYLPISLMLLSNYNLKDLKVIYSKQEVFGQCRNWIEKHVPNVELVSVESTTKAVTLAIREENSASIAGISASELYGIDIIAKNIQDIHGNSTRFLVIGHNYGDSSGNDKTSLVLGVKHEAGSLYRILSVFKNKDINLSKIESRPSRNKAWEYYFFVDVDGHVDDSPLGDAVEELKKECITLTILGSYPKVKN
tara:strand:- start:288 stop:1352 length:1065 start_codon:yes stop_codon:yes gene_type:complete